MSTLHPKSIIYNFTVVFYSVGAHAKGDEGAQVST